MLNSIAKQLQPIEGLTKRQQSKLQRLMRNDEVHKAQNDYKCYKRKASKSKVIQEPELRKITKVSSPTSQNEDKKVEDVPVSGTSTFPQENNKQNQSSVELSKKELRTLKPYNLTLPIEGGEAGLFNYIIGYVCTQKQKLLQAEYQDPTFLDTIQGKQLQLLPSQEISLSQPNLLQQFSLQKYKITEPFDQTHRSLLNKLMSTKTDK